VVEEYCWEITGGGEIMLLPNWLRCAGIWISAGHPCVYMYG